MFFFHGRRGTASSKFLSRQAGLGEKFWCREKNKLKRANFSNSPQIRFVETFWRRENDPGKFQTGNFESQKRFTAKEC
jgi:hypothetical protein